MAHMRGYHVPLPPRKDILCVYIIILYMYVYGFVWYRLIRYRT